MGDTRRQGGRVEVLTIERLDLLTLAMFADMELPRVNFTVGELVPLVEWAWLGEATSAAGTLRGVGSIAALQHELRSGQVLSTLTMGAPAAFIRLRRQQQDTENGGWLRFLTMFDHAARDAGLNKTLARQLTGVVKEMEDNVHLHSGCSSSGLVAFARHTGMFELVVLDRGIGVLESLRQAPEFSSLTDHGTALQLAVSDGKSRFGTAAGRGMGFSDLTVGVANANALIRLRSGDYLLKLDGRGQGDITPECVQRAGGRGFLIAVQVMR
jgi:hypothetical protein